MNGRQKTVSFLLLLIFALGICGCTRMKITDYKDTNPRFKPEEHFEGNHVGYGAFFGRFSSQPKEFKLKLQGEKTAENVLVLEEELLWKDGKKESRQYIFTKLSDHEYTVKSESFKEPGRILSYGNALQWSYKLKVPTESTTWVLKFDDWMFLHDDGAVVNRAQAYKYGIYVGEVVMTIYPANE